MLYFNIDRYEFRVFIVSFNFQTVHKFMNTEIENKHNSILADFTPEIHKKDSNAKNMSTIYISFSID